LARAPSSRPAWTAQTTSRAESQASRKTQFRAVTLERTVWAGRILPALQEQSWSLQGEKSLDILTLATSLARAREMVQFVKETQ